jgi:hypothetical protein
MDEKHPIQERMRLNGQEHDEAQQTTTSTVTKKDEIPLEDDEASSNKVNKASQV